jgi:hypothetical protein
MYHVTKIMHLAVIRINYKLHNPIYFVLSIAYTLYRYMLRFGVEGVCRSKESKGFERRARVGVE